MKNNIKKYYTVNGSTGEYDDYRCWTVCAFSTKAKANVLAKKLNNWLIKKGLHSSQDTCTAWIDFDDSKDSHPEDPNCDVDFTGTNYVVSEIEFSG